ncbi:MAG: hypothetical protein AAGA97_02630 [Pseudomonadota bacterium]
MKFFRFIAGLVTVLGFLIGFSAFIEPESIPPDLGMAAPVVAVISLALYLLLNARINNAPLRTPKRPTPLPPKPTTPVEPAAAPAPQPERSSPPTYGNGGYALRLVLFAAHSLCYVTLQSIGGLFLISGFVSLLFFVFPPFSTTGPMGGNLLAIYGVVAMMMAIPWKIAQHIFWPISQPSMPARPIAQPKSAPPSTEPKPNPQPADTFIRPVRRH